MFTLSACLLITMEPMLLCSCCAARNAESSRPEISSLEDELEATLKKINLKDFEYVPVPRTDDDDE